MRKLRAQQYKLKQVSFRLKKRDEALFKTCIRALKNHNKDRATICANEIAEIKKLIKFLYNVELAIERVIIRLETIRELSDIIINLKPALKMLQKVSKQLFEVLPSVSSELNRVNNAINETLYSTRITLDPSAIPVNRITLEGKEILKEVSSFLEQKIAEELPEPPAALETPMEVPVKQMVALATACSQTVSQKTVETVVSSQDLFSFKESELQEFSLKVETPSLEDVLLEYVKKSKGEVDLMQCSLKLNASYTDIE
ncbi:Snf7 family protein, partial [Candidatus Bathyarchaeota archaeon]|nr:Snf7 family protein [Candidatus Bathyarchaeota archaeon]